MNENAIPAPEPESTKPARHLDGSARGFPLSREWHDEERSSG